MAKRSSQTFAKRQKELARKEKQQQKAQKRVERKQLKAERGPNTGPEVYLPIDPADLGLDDSMPAGLVGVLAGDEDEDDD